MKKQKLIVRLFSSYFVLVLLALALLIMFAYRAIEDFYFEQNINNLQARAIFVDEILRDHESIDSNSLQNLCKQLGEETATRITLVIPSGQVLADSEEDPRNMDLHNDRPEIIQALQTSEGVSRRSSYTMEEEHLYYARLCSHKDHEMVIRVSFPTMALKSALHDLRYNLFLGGVIISILLGFLSWYVSGQILKPIAIMEIGARRFARGKLKMKVPESNIQELGSLGHSLNLMAEQIYDRIRFVTQQKNEQLAILSSMTEGVLALNPAGDILSFNHAAAIMFGLQTKTVVGRPLHEVIRNTELIDFSSKILDGKKSQECQISIFEPEDRKLNVVGSPMPKKKGAIGGAVLVFTDLTQIQKLEGVRREFVANVSHELKTPITSIQGYVETLLDGAVDDIDNAQNFLEIIAKHATRLGQIVDDLLELSRIEEFSEDETQHRSPITLSPLVDATVRDIQALADSRSISIVKQIDPYLQVDLNEKLFSHALGNLLDNAVKYSGEGSTITLKTELQDGHAILEVTDTGQGIEREHLSRIFERFYRVDKGRSRDVGGTGLGLSIVKHIALVHNAELEVESVPGEGSTFRLLFPTASTS
ncbi:MAG: PAS domain-containing protein [Candidatus Marinimicrobia bacterium]|nr:PAS domain-containing protein [Candidatus Neomarinimicrobiota bacterium]